MKVKDFDKFQHFKDRRPPWVKLYRDILDDPEWHELDAESAKVLVMLWLIASEDETKTGTLPSMKKLSFRLRIDQNKLENICINLSHWLVHDDINAISERYQVDAPETEGETETYTEKSLVVSKLTPCPHQEILFLFSEELSELPQPRIWEGKRQSNLQARWKWVMGQADKDGKEATKEYGLDFFRRMFAYIAKSDFLMGRNSPWSCDLGWIVNSTNFAKILDGNYENKVAA